MCSVSLYPGFMHRKWKLIESSFVHHHRCQRRPYRVFRGRAQRGQGPSSCLYSQQASLFRPVMVQNAESVHSIRGSFSSRWGTHRGALLSHPAPSDEECDCTGFRNIPLLRHTSAYRRTYTPRYSSGHHRCVFKSYCAQHTNALIKVIVYQNMKILSSHFEIFRRKSRLLKVNTDRNCQATKMTQSTIIMVYLQYV